MYAKYWRRLFARVGVGAALLCLLGSCRAGLLQVTLGALDGVRSFSGRTGELPGEAALYFHCKGRRVLLRSEGAFGVSIDRNYSSGAWHLELKVCVVQYRIELSECGSPEQCVITTAKRDYIED